MNRILSSTDQTVTGSIGIPPMLRADMNADGASGGSAWASDVGAAVAAGRQIVFIEGNVPDAAELAAGVAPGVRAVILDPNQDGVAQIAAYLASHKVTGLAGIDIVAHGSDGLVQLGTAALSSATLPGFQTALADIGAALKPGGAIQIFGCDVAQDAAGVAFLDQLSAATGGASIAAASHLVGAASGGGSWDLNVDTGTIHVGSPFTAAAEAAYPAELPSGPPIVVTASGTVDVQAGGTVTVDPGLTVTGGSAGDLTGATVTFTLSPSEPTAAGAEAFFTNQNGITGSFNATTDTETLSSASGTDAQYQAALRSITFTPATPEVAGTLLDYTVSWGITQQPAGPPSSNVSTSYVDETVCFRSGTLIRTPHGDVAVETLAIGDLLVTASGAHRPIRWLGHRTINCRSYRNAAQVMPIRISAGALGTNKPVRDLHVSPGHAICIDVIEEVLIPASALINGTTIVQLDVDEVTYWHVELESHDILLAENMPAESYLEMGNRTFFGETVVTALNAPPDTAVNAPERTHADFCRPFHADGPLVQIVKQQIRARARSMGWTLDESPLADLHLVVDGVRLEPTTRGLVARFTVPAGAENVWLVSDTSRPMDVCDSTDDRDLGAMIAGLTIDDGFSCTRPIDIADPLLCAGYHHLEEGCKRWTAGRAHLPAALWADSPDGFFLRVDLAGPTPARWVAPTSIRMPVQEAQRA